MTILYSFFYGLILKICYTYFGEQRDQGFFHLSCFALSKIWYMLQKHQGWRLFSLENVVYAAQGLRTSSKPNSEPTASVVSCLIVFAKDHIRSAIKSSRAYYSWPESESIFAQANRFSCTDMMRLSSQGYFKNWKEQSRERKPLCGTSQTNILDSQCHPFHLFIRRKKSEASGWNMTLFFFSFMGT